MLEDSDHPLIIEPALFAAVSQKLFDGRPKRRGRFQNTDPHLLHGLLFSDCHDHTLRPAYYSSRPDLPSQPNVPVGDIFCSCGQRHPERGYCVRVPAYVILEPVREHVLSQISYSEVADEVAQRIKTDYEHTQNLAQSYKRECQRLKEEIDTIRHNLALIRLDASTALVMEQEINNRLNELRVLEARAMQPYSAPHISSEDLEFVAAFLSDMREQWENVPRALQARLFQLILDKVVIHPLEDHDFVVDVQWKGGPTDVLWIERPLWNSLRRPWTNEEIALLRQHYAAAEVKTLVALFPGKLWDGLRVEAHQLKLRRERHYDPTPWSSEEDQLLRQFAQQAITYKAMRQALRHRRSSDIERRVAKLGIKMPDTRRIVWHLVNTTQNEACRKARCPASSTSPSARHRPPASCSTS